MTLFQIKNRFNEAVQFECELSAEIAGKSYRFQLGFAIKKAIEAGVNLSDANLSGANLSGANLSGVNLSFVNLSGVNLSGVNLSFANLSFVNLSDANLSGANLWGVNLSFANLSFVNLSGVNLSDVNLSGVNLSGAYLAGVNLSGAYLLADLKLVGKRPFLSICSIGSDARQLFIYLTGNGVYIRRGCFFDTYANFQAQVEETL